MTLLKQDPRYLGRWSTGNARFRRFFPDYAPTMPIYLVHSLGEMDGGTRELRGKVIAVFGADVIARIHDAATIGPFLDHELFHFYHAPYFRECEAMWCSLWAEGLATYVAAKMNPGADDRALLLSEPQPIRAPVDARFAEAACLALAKLDSTSQQDIGGFFFANAPFAGWPPRIGYYLGMRVAAQVGEGVPLATLAKMPAAQVRPRVAAALRGFGNC